MTKLITSLHNKYFVITGIGGRLVVSGEEKVGISCYSESGIEHQEPRIKYPASSIWQPEPDIR